MGSFRLDVDNADVDKRGGTGSPRRMYFDSPNAVKNDMHATEFLKNPRPAAGSAPMLVVFGPQAHLKRQVVQKLTAAESADDEPLVVRFSGKDVDFVTVRDELRTASMWGGSRTVLIEPADKFVQDNRERLEAYLKSPAKTAQLVLLPETWNKNTRLHKALDPLGLAVECADLKGAALDAWVRDTARKDHGKTLQGEAARLLIELAGNDLGLLSQQIDKLVVYVGDQAAVSPADVTKLVGGWKAETTWNMVDAVYVGDVPAALACLDKLLNSGEHPLFLLGGLTFAFRKLADATEWSRQGTPLPEALSKAGVFPFKTQLAASYLKRIGRPRAARLREQLQKADTALKSTSGRSDRLVLEQLLVELTAPSALLATTS